MSVAMIALLKITHARGLTREFALSFLLKDAATLVLHGYLDRSSPCEIEPFH